jgi:hypothetical protein
MATITVRDYGERERRSAFRQRSSPTSAVHAVAPEAAVQHVVSDTPVVAVVTGESEQDVVSCLLPAH